MIRNIPFIPAMLLPLCITPVTGATVSIGAGGYTENFDSLAASGSSEPAAGWTGRYGASSTSLGTTASIGPVRAWTHTSGQFKNVSSSNIDPGSDSTAQSANSNRAFAMRQVSSTGDPGMSFAFNFSSEGRSIDTLSFDLLLLDPAGRSTTLFIQYGFGTDPVSFETLGSWSDPGAFGATHFAFDRNDFGSALDDRSQAWFRIVALDPTTGSGGYDMIAIDNFSITVDSVPEPSAVALGLLGFAGLLRRRR